MKFQMIFEGVDRASKIMNKLKAAEEKTAKAMRAGAKAGAAASAGATRATERHASVLSKIGSIARSAYNGVVAGAQAAARATVALHNKSVALAKSGFGQIGAGAQKAFRGVALAAGVATIAFGSSAFAANQLLDTAKAFESYRIQLETLEGSAAKGQQAMAWITEFAVKTPLELDQVVEAYRNLKTFGLDPTNGTLMSLVDTMAASGKGAEQLAGLTLAVGQAWTKGKLQGEEALQLLERGVPVWDILSKKYKKSAADLQDMASKGELGREAIQYLIDEMGRRNSGASEKMSRTWEGMIGNLMDTWLQFKLAIMDAGLFEWMKSRLQLVLETVNRMADDGTLQKWAEYVSNRVVMVLSAAWEFGTRVYEILSRLGEYLSVAAEYVGGWERLAGILAGMAFAPILISTAAGLVQIAMGLSMLSAALMANPIALAIAAIVAGAALIYLNWEPIKAFFVGMWDAISSAATNAWNGIKDWLGFDPVPVLSKLWDAHKLLAAMGIETLRGLVESAWTNLKALFAWSPSQALLASGWGDVGTMLQRAWDAIPPLTWDNFITALDWLSWIHPLRWLDFIPGFSWAGIISGTLDWGRYIVSLDWTKYLPSFSWGGVLTALNWLSYIHPVRWLDFIPGFSWTGIISGALDWGSYIVSLDWTKYLPTFSWPEIPAFSWPAIPALELPALPDVAGWIGEFGNAAMSAIEDVSGRIGNAWAKVKSAFSFGSETAEIIVTDPATILAASEATAKLSADMQAVTGIDTGPAMDRLTALDAAAKGIVPVITSVIGQARSYLAGVSFYDQGAALMDTMAAGMRARAMVVVNEIQRMAQMVRDHLPSSPAKVGPLSDIHRLKFGETIAASIRAEPMVRAMRAASAATMAAAAISAPNVATASTGADAARAEVARASVQSAASGSSGNTYHFSPTVPIPAGAGAPADIKQAVMDALRESSREFAAMMEEEDRRRARRET